MSATAMGALTVRSEYSTKTCTWDLYVSGGSLNYWDGIVGLLRHTAYGRLGGFQVRLPKYKPRGGQSNELR